MTPNQTTLKNELKTTANPTQPPLPMINKCLHVNPQSKGGLGKSFEVELRTSWLDRHDIAWRGYDLDDRHRTFSERHPEEVKNYEFGNAVESKTTFMTLLRGVHRSPAPLHVLDMRAQADALFMDALTQLNFVKLCREQGTRITFFLFTSDDLESMENFRALVKFGAKSVNYVIVKNPTKTHSKLFAGSPLETGMLNMGAKIIELPEITPATMVSMDRAEGKAQRGISFAEFASPTSRHLSPAMMAELQWSLARAYEQYDAIADLLLPPDLATKVQATKAEAVAKKKPLSSEEDFGFNFDDSEDD